MGTQLPPQKGAQPHFSAHVYCDQTARWIKMPLGMEVGLGQGHIVLDGDPAPPTERGTPTPSFAIYGRRIIRGSSLLSLKGWMDQNATWYGGIGLGPGDIVLCGDPAPPRKGTQQSPTFRLVSIVTTRSPISAAAEHLLTDGAGRDRLLFLRSTAIMCNKLNH